MTLLTRPALVTTPEQVAEKVLEVANVALVLRIQSQNRLKVFDQFIFDS